MDSEGKHTTRGGKLMTWHELRIREGNGFVAGRLAVRFEVSSHKPCVMVLYPGATRYILIEPFELWKRQHCIDQAS